MKEHLISFKTAKLAHEKGYTRQEIGISFASARRNYYTEKGDLNGDVAEFVRQIVKHGKDKVSYTLYPATSQSLLQQWLREKHNCFVEVSLHGEEDKNWDVNPKNLLFGVTVDYYGEDFKIPMGEEEDFNDYNFKSYEEALERGLYESLKLIKTK